MNWKKLALLFGLSMLISFSALAGHRDGYRDKHYRGHHGKHHRHHNKHHGRFYYSHGERGSRCRHRSHFGHGRYTQFYDLPHFAMSATYGYSDRGAVLVYESYPRSGRRY